MRKGGLVGMVFACGLAASACGASGTSADGAPRCPLDGGVDHGDYAECGGGCTLLHQQGVCSPGYVCTCAGVCTWWSSFTDGGAIQPGPCYPPDAAVAPPCPLDGGVDHGDYAECGGGCTLLHQQGVCSPGYVCTCAGVCTWWAVFYPDGGPGPPGGCYPVDASLP
jgi:hypothetical protein